MRCWIIWIFGFQGEKLLGSLGGMFSKTWKPKKTRPINGPIITRGLLLGHWYLNSSRSYLFLPNCWSHSVFWVDHSPTRRVNHLEKREKLGLNPAPKGQSRTREPLPESADAYQKVEVRTSLPSLLFFLSEEHYYTPASEISVAWTLSIWGQVMQMRKDPNLRCWWTLKASFVYIWVKHCLLDATKFILVYYRWKKLSKTMGFQTWVIYSAS